MPWWRASGGDGNEGDESSSLSKHAESGIKNGRRLPPAPDELPLLPLYSAVLLALGFLRLRVSPSSAEEAALCKHLYRLQNGAPEGTPGGAITVAGRPRALVAAVPVVNSAVAVDISGSGTFLRPPTGSWSADSEIQPQRAVAPAESNSDAADKHLFPLGTAAVVLQVEKVKVRGEPVWDILLEGLYRVGIDQVEQQSGSLFFNAKVTQLDGELGSPASDGSSPSTLAEQQHGDSVLSEKLLDISGRLIERLRSAIASRGANRSSRTRTSATMLVAMERLRTMLGSLAPARSADLLATALADPAEKLAVLSAVNANKRILLVISLANAALRALGRTSDIVDLMGNSIKRESPGGSPAGGVPAADATEQSEIAALTARLKAAEPPPEVLEAGMKELSKLEKMGEQHPAAAGARAYVELLVELPWRRTASDLAAEAAAAAAAAPQDEVPEVGVGTPPPPPLLDAPLSLELVKEALDKGHKGLEKVKQRILEYVAVGRLTSRDGTTPKGSILCFIGPPGVGKTSLADSIAGVLGRPLARIALGGVRDEAEIRGHRRTYIGAMPGRVLQGLRRVKCRDPVMLLDEVDKMGSDVRGDPTAALLEVLDPAQHHAFVDTFLGLPFDLSKVVFVATANEEGAIPAPLRDRMEIIRLSGYTTEERLAIAEAHLVPRVLSAHGLPPGGVSFAPGALEALIRGWTAEAGVRDLERRLAAIARHLALALVMRREASDGAPLLLGSAEDTHGHKDAHGDEAEGPPVVVDEALLQEILGPKRYTGHEAEERISGPGAAAGLVWTPVGGSLQFVEACLVNPGRPGREGQLTLTGQLGGVLEESARIALSWVRSNAARLGLVHQGAASPLPLPLHHHHNNNLNNNQLNHLNGNNGNSNSNKTGVAQLSASAGPLIHGRHFSSALSDADSSNSSGAAAASSVPAVFGADVHVHFPAGAIPKDGPSAGVTLACALVSLFSGRPVRDDVAMTGELSLRGLVLPVGGVKEKLLAARQAGMAAVLIPARNMPDVEADLPPGLRTAMEVLPCSSMEDVLASAFAGGFPLLSAPVPSRL